MNSVEIHETQIKLLTNGITYREAQRERAQRRHESRMVAQWDREIKRYREMLVTEVAKLAAAKQAVMQMTLIPADEPADEVMGGAS